MLDKAKQVSAFLFSMVMVAGSIACVLVWLDVKPKDLRIVLGLPHWGWLVGGIVLYAISLISSGYFLGRSSRPESAAVMSGEGESSKSLCERSLDDDLPSLSDPIIRVEIMSEATDVLHKETHFVLHNDSERTAFNIKMGDIDLSSGKIGKAIASFEAQDAIPGKGERTVIPKIEGNAPLFLHDVIPYMEWKIEEDPEVRSEISVPATLVYEDYRKQGFCTAFDMAFISRRDVREERKREWAKKLINLPLEARNQRFKKVPKK